MIDFFKLLRPLADTAPALVASIFIAGCSLIPAYERPAAPLPAQWPASAGLPGGGTGDAAQPAAAPAWQDYFADPALRRLIEVALTNNRDLRVARLNIEQASAQLGVRRADQFPTLGAAITGSRNPSGNGSYGTMYNAGLAISAYELDFFGRVASLKEQALDQYLASAEAAQSARISLIATVAQGWLSLLADQELLALANQTVSSRTESLQLVELRLQNGAASELDHRLAQTLLEAGRVTLAQQTRQQALDENALGLLLGRPLNDALPAELPRPALSQLQFGELPAGLPSSLLTRRPDIRQAEQLLLASNANIGAARAAFFPRISLTAGAGSASSELGNLFHSGTWGWTPAPQLLLPIFDAGRNRANLDSAQAGRAIAEAQYEKAIQSAFREVADALASRSTLAQQLQAQQALLEAETQRNQLTQLRLQHGAASQLDGLDAQRSLFAAQQALVQTRLASLQSQIAVFKALGGGGVLGSQ